MLQLNKKQVTKLAKAMVANGGMIHAKALDMIASAAGYRSYNAMLPTLKEEAGQAPDLKPLFEAIETLWNSSSTDGCDGCSVVDEQALLDVGEAVRVVKSQSGSTVSSRPKETSIVIWIADGKVSQVSSASPMDVLVVDLDYLEGGHVVDGQSCTINSAYNACLGADLQALVDEVKQAFDKEESGAAMPVLSHVERQFARAESSPAQYRVTEDSDQPGLWVWTNECGDGCEVSFTSMQEAMADAVDHFESVATANLLGYRVFAGLGVVANLYENGTCPDCGEDIPLTAVHGEECLNCGHVFYAQEAEADDEVAQVNNAESVVICAYSLAKTSSHCFWSNSEGWTEFDQATRFTQQESESFELPTAGGIEQVQWVPIQQALQEARSRYLDAIRSNNRWIDGYSLTHLAAQVADLDESQLIIAAHNGWLVSGSSATSVYFAEKTEYPNSPCLAFELRIEFKRDSDALDVYSVVQKY